jgi:dCMP deaminase
MRTTFEEVYMRLAMSMSERSTCARMKVGCAITSIDYRQVFAVGYNGSAAGGPNDCDLHGPEASGRCGCIHSEMNAVINCTAPRREPKIVFCTHLPCVNCAKCLINLGGVRGVYYVNEYRIKDSLGWFERAGIQVLPFPRLDQMERQYQAMFDNLTSVQARCTELLLENRRLNSLLKSGT